MVYNESTDSGGTHAGKMRLFYIGTKGRSATGVVRRARFPLYADSGESDAVIADGCI